MIVTKLMGGHSNQLFQYAIGRQLAIKNNTELLLDLSWFGNIPDTDTQRVYELDVYPLKAGIADMGKIDVRTQDKQASFIEKVKRKLGIDVRVWQLSQVGNGFNERVLTSPNNTMLVGWWQCERYFNNIRDELLLDFEPITPLSAKNEKIILRIKATESIWMHVRRGDYVTNIHANKHHGLKGFDYYKKALDEVVKRLPTEKQKNVEIFVCSNDISWCKKNFEFKYPITYIENVLGSDDMRVAKHCKHDILANSTFSWWGAWLNNNPNKIVVAPKTWFEDDVANNETEIVPERWIRL